MDYQEALHVLNIIQQEHLLNYWESLSIVQQKILLDSIQSIDLPTFFLQRNLLNPHPFFTEEISPFQNYEKAGNLTDIEKGQELISEGKMGCLMIAGGQGTRLQLSSPKGIFPVSIIKHKSLFQIFAEKVKSASELAQRPLLLAIMTSPQNHMETLQYFEDHHFFGLEKAQVDFFSQEPLPFLDNQGNLFLENPYTIAKGPNGNGLSLKYFWRSGIGLKWLTKGVRYLNYVLVDNPLADPFDAELVGFHHRQNNDVTIKCTLRRNENEKTGIILEKNHKISVVEYSELPDEERFAKTSQGLLKHACANLSLFCINLDFIRFLEDSHVLFPLHKAFKPTKYFLPEGIIDNMAWKFEYFIFDMLLFAERISALLYPRHQIFAPLKNLEGPDNLSDVQHALQNRDREIFKEITGSAAPKIPFELATDFYYPTKTLLEKWKDKSFPSQSYIEP